MPWAGSTASSLATRVKYSLGSMRATCAAGDAASKGCGDAGTGSSAPGPGHRLNGVSRICSWSSRTPA